MRRRVFSAAWVFWFNLEKVRYFQSLVVMHVGLVLRLLCFLKFVALLLRQRRGNNEYESETWTSGVCIFLPSAARPFVFGISYRYYQERYERTGRGG